MAENVVCGPDPERHVEAIRGFADAGYDHVYFHQVGPDQQGFFEFSRASWRPGSPTYASDGHPSPRHGLALNRCAFSLGYLIGSPTRSPTRPI